MSPTQRNISRRAALASATALTIAGKASRAFADETETDQEIGQDQTEPTALASAEVTRFLYIDSKELEAGTEQHVALSLIDYEPTDATLDITCAETGEGSNWGMTAADGATVLFTFTPEAGSYSVSRITFTTASGTYDVDFSDCDESHRSFSVSDGVATQSEEDVDEELNVTSVDVDGTTVESDTVEEGVAAVAASAAGANARSATGNPDEDGLIVVALDPGHGGYDGGASGVNGSDEATMTWKIAQACKTELERYGGVSVFLTREKNECPSIEDRAIVAIGKGADVLVSLHLNSIDGGGARGAEVWAPNDSSYNPQTHTMGEKLANEIMDELAALGLSDRGIKFRDYIGYEYPDGSTGDYYGITRYARKGGIPGIIVEHAFINNSGDYNQFLASDSKLATLGEADATGIAQAFGLTVATESDYAAVYDKSYYLEHNSDVKKAFGGDAAATFRHFLVYGMAEGRQGCSGFDATYYRNANADLREMFGSNMACYYLHYIRHGKSEGRAGTGTATQVDTMWRMYNKNTGEHFYTASDYERNVLVYEGWNYEGAGWTAPTKSSTPVYRLFNSHVKGGDHHYTTSVVERKDLIGRGWNDEGVGWYSADSDGVKIYRQYNPNAKTGTHNFTESKYENDALVKKGWRAEGVAWYGL